MGKSVKKSHGFLCIEREDANFFLQNFEQWFDIPRYSAADTAHEVKVYITSALRTQILAQKCMAGHYFCPAKHFGVGVPTTTSRKLSHLPLS